MTRALVLTLATITATHGGMMSFGSGRMPVIRNLPTRKQQTSAIPLTTETRKAFRLPAIPNHLALPVLSYTTLAGATAGVLRLLQPFAWQGMALTGMSVGLPVIMILAQLATSGGSGVAKSMGGIKTDDARLERLAFDAASAVGVPHPTVFEVKSKEPNAFAASGIAGGDPTVTVTTGLREILTDDELSAVLAHEMGHLLHRDVLRNMHVAAAAAGLGGIYEVGRVLVQSDRKSKRKSKSSDDDKDNSMAIGLGLMAAGATTKVAAHFLRLMASRDAELRADRAAAEAYGAQSIISALQKIDKYAAQRPADFRQRSGAKAYAHAMISDGSTPSAGSESKLRQRSWLSKLGYVLRTHPTLDKRVAALEKAAADGAVPAKRSKFW